MVRFKVRKFLAAGRLADAEAYASQHGITVEQAKVVALPSPKPAVSVEAAQFAQINCAPKELVEVMPTLETFEVPGKPVVEMVNGWPVASPAVIFRECINKRLIIVKLPDDRQVAAYRGMRCPPLGTDVRVKLVEATADPIYELVFAPPT